LTDLDTANNMLPRFCRRPYMTTDAKSLSVLRKARAEDVVTEPFPHLVIRDALPDAVCDALIAEYPPLDALAIDGNDNNRRWSVTAWDARRNPRIAPIWQELVAYHASRAFYDELIDVFGEHVTHLYPRLFPDVATLRSQRVGLRERDSFEDFDVLVDAQISGNTPVSDASSVKTIHIDSEHKLFTGLLYLRRPEDDSVGGDLNIVRFRDDLTRGQARRRYDGMFVDDALTEYVSTVPYQRNMLLLFVNGLSALHGVTVRQPTSHLRLFLNLVCETREKLFDVPQHWQTRAAKLPRLIGKRLRRVAGLPV
jgi:hypothetical protein